MARAPRTELWETFAAYRALSTEALACNTRCWINSLTDRPLPDESPLPDILKHGSLLLRLATALNVARSRCRHGLAVPPVPFLDGDCIERKPRHLVSTPLPAQHASWPRWPSCEGHLRRVIQCIAIEIAELRPVSGCRRLWRIRSSSC